MVAGYASSDQDTDELEEGGLDDGDVDVNDDDIPGAIETANCRVCSVKDLYERMKTHRIDVEPPYQRDVVWPRSSQSALVDSIFKNKWVPTLLFSQRPCKTDKHGDKVKSKWVCMDGKQRLTSIKLFINGEIPWYKKPGKPFYFKQSFPPSPSRHILSEELQEIFLTRGLTTALYSNLSELQERDIFRLVQEGKPLTIGEKMQAAAGPWGEYFDELTQKYMVRNEDKPNGWCGRIANLKRGADFRTMTHMVLLIRDKGLRAPEPPRFFTSAALQKEMSLLANEPVPSSLKREVKQLLDSFMDISTLAPPKTPYTVELNTPPAMHAPIQRGKKSMLSPVEMIWIPYMIAYHGNQLSKGRLLELIELFKVDIRQRYPSEVKNNTTVTRFIVDWIRNADTRKLKGKYAGFAVPRLTEDSAQPDTSGMSEMAKRNLSLQNAAKRKPPPTVSTDSSLNSSSSTLPAKKARLTDPQPTPSNRTEPTLSKVSASRPQPVAPTPVRADNPPDSVNTTHLTTSQPTVSKALTSAVPAGSTYSIEAQAMLAAERAKAAANGSPFLMSNALPTLSSSQPRRSMPAPTAPRSLFPPGGSRIVPNYPTQAGRTTGFQLPSKPSGAFNNQTTAQPQRPNSNQYPRNSMPIPKLADIQQTELFRAASPNLYQPLNTNMPTWKVE